MVLVLRFLSTIIIYMFDMCVTLQKSLIATSNTSTPYVAGEAPDPDPAEYLGASPGGVKSDLIIPSPLGMGG